MNSAQKPDDVKDTIPTFVIVPCPKCNHEIRRDYSWLKVSTTMGCPNCSQLIRVVPPKQEPRKRLPGGAAMWQAIQEAGSKIRV